MRFYRGERELALARYRYDHPAYKLCRRDIGLRIPIDCHVDVCVCVCVGVCVCVRTGVRLHSAHTRRT